MALIERFEDLIAWQKARELAREAFEATTREPFCRGFGLKDQLNRSAASVAANIAEGFERGSRAEFHRFLVIAKGSCGEVRSHLYLAVDRRYLSPPEFDRLATLNLEVARLVGGLRASVARQRQAQNTADSGHP